MSTVQIGPSEIPPELNRHVMKDETTIARDIQEGKQQWTMGIQRLLAFLNNTVPSPAPLPTNMPAPVQPPVPASVVVPPRQPATPSVRTQMPNTSTIPISANDPYSTILARSNESNGTVVPLPTQAVVVSQGTTSNRNSSNNEWLRAKFAENDAAIEMRRQRQQTQAAMRKVVNKGAPITTPAPSTSVTTRPSVSASILSPAPSRQRTIEQQLAENDALANMYAIGGDKRRQRRQGGDMGGVEGDTLATPSAPSRVIYQVPSEVVNYVPVHVSDYKFPASSVQSANGPWLPRTALREYERILLEENGYGTTPEIDPISGLPVPDTTSYAFHISATTPPITMSMDEAKRRIPGVVFPGHGVQSAMSESQTQLEGQTPVYWGPPEPQISRRDMDRLDNGQYVSSGALASALTYRPRGSVGNEEA